MSLANLQLSSVASQGFNFVTGVICDERCLQVIQAPKIPIHSKLNPRRRHLCGKAGFDQISARRRQSNP